MRFDTVIGEDAPSVFDYAKAVQKIPASQALVLSQPTTSAVVVPWWGFVLGGMAFAAFGKKFVGLIGMGLAGYGAWRGIKEMWKR